MDKAENISEAGYLTQFNVSILRDFRAYLGDCYLDNNIKTDIIERLHINKHDIVWRKFKRKAHNRAIIYGIVTNCEYETLDKHLMKCIYVLPFDFITYYLYETNDSNRRYYLLGVNNNRYYSSKKR